MKIITGKEIFTCICGGYGIYYHIVFNGEYAILEEI
jgi:hypothetical protein